MKKILLTLLLLTSFSLFSQNNALLKTWNLYSLYINGVTKDNPFPNVGYIEFKIENDRVYADTVYYYLAGKTKIIIDSDSKLHLENPNGWAMLANGPGENQQMNQYGSLYFYQFLKVNSQVSTDGCCFTYDISENGRKLTLTTDEGNIATFYDSVMAVSETEKPQYKIYPNPASDLITIENLTPNTAIELIDNSGKMVKKAVSGNFTKTEINIKNIAAGVYYLKINNQSVQKVIKK